MEYLVLEIPNLELLESQRRSRFFYFNNYVS